MSYNNIGPRCSLSTCLMIDMLTQTSALCLCLTPLLSLPPRILNPHLSSLLPPLTTPWLQNGQSEQVTFLLRELVVVDAGECRSCKDYEDETRYDDVCHCKVVCLHLGSSSLQFLIPFTHRFRLTFSLWRSFTANCCRLFFWAFTLLWILIRLLKKVINIIDIVFYINFCWLNRINLVFRVVV